MVVANWLRKQFLWIVYDISGTAWRCTIVSYSSLIFHIRVPDDVCVYRPTTRIIGDFLRDELYGLSFNIDRACIVLAVNLNSRSKFCASMTDIYFACPSLSCGGDLWLAQIRVVFKQLFSRVSG